MKITTLFRLLLLPFDYIKFKLLERKAKIKKNELGLVFPYHMGDLYNLCVFVNQIKRRYKANIVLVLQKKYTPVVKMFRDNVRIVAVNDYELPYPLLGYVDYNLLKLISKPAKGKLAIYTLYNVERHEIFIKEYFNIEKIKWRKPSILKKTIYKKLINKFKRLGLKPKRTVILYPVSYSAPLLPNKFWEELAEEIKKKGYTVATNVIGNEKEIKGTIPLYTSIEEKFASAEIAGTVIGIRSGIFDVISYANCKKIIIYTGSQKIDNRNTQISYYNVHSLKDRIPKQLRKKLYELIPSKFNNTYFMSIFLNMIISKL
jgi:hypothetical protein